MVILSTAVRRRRQKFRQSLWTLAKFICGMILLVVVSYAAFEAGKAKNDESVRRMRAELLDAENQKLELIAAKETAEERVRRMAGTLAQLERDYQQNVPEGDLAELVLAIRERIAAGIDPDRLKFVIGTAAFERKCDKSTETQPLLVRTPLSTNLDNTVGFAKNRVVVSAEGQPMRDDAGVALGFFDPDKPIAIRFLMISGELERVSKTLPLTHSVVVDDDEYQIQVLADSRRGYLAVTVRRCDYP